MSGKQLETIKEHKDLGVLVDLELKFHHHLCNVYTSKASQVLGNRTPFGQLYVSLIVQIFGTPTLRICQCYLGRGGSRGWALGAEAPPPPLH